MKIFIEEKITNWRRTTIEVPENMSREEIEKITKENVEELFFLDDFSDTEYLYDTTEVMSPDNNEGDSTVGVFVDDECIWENGKKGSC